ncbi:anti-phage dCTP deaminase [Nisaea acidiphila]|uniref:Anti-phage dCTP deaminase n=1 Tax=Nisaea acidiphila TaxID=1862145 RepID=A0A9J7ANX9_9PROT|nr:anti-phage dCTP deaminase [Nisaea acidiphila]UUX49120.1 anti-phage dCTP deaminase [Nisaea acidiphila]
MGARAELKAANEDKEKSAEPIAPISKELVVGLVGYVGAGCSTAARRLGVLLEAEEYEVQRIKLSDLIAEMAPAGSVPDVKEGIEEGRSKFDRAEALQGMGDKLRESHGDFAVASLAAKKIQELRGSRRAGEHKIAFILDSIKHSAEVNLLRQVYDRSFRLIAVHCERSVREKRLIGAKTETKKYSGVEVDGVFSLMDRDEKDSENSHGQQVRDAFYLADFFIDNNGAASDGALLTGDLDRFIKLVLGGGIIRPTQSERGMYCAHVAALQSSCLSRQVGAALIDRAGTLVSTGTNEVPSFGGGVYEEGMRGDNRCHAWGWVTHNGKEEIKFTGCHNQRKKKQLRSQIGEWLSNNLSEIISELSHPKPKDGAADTAAKAREKTKERVKDFFESDDDLFLKIPGIKDIVEYSRSIHAEMNALFNAARSGAKTTGATLYCTTYPCHNCARHMVTAGIYEVQYIEPYVKSLATELHYDSISSERIEKGKTPDRMVVVPFTGVGPRMYEDFFTKRAELKDESGTLVSPSADVPQAAVRVLNLEDVEKKAVELVSRG